MRKVLFFSILILCLQLSSAHSSEFHPLFRGARAQAMGNAFTAVADDEQAIFYNPAGLAGIKKFSLNLASVNGEVSNDLISSVTSLSSAFENPGISTLNAFMGKNVYFRAQGTASLVLPGFGAAVLWDEQSALRLQNQSLIQATVGLQNTYGAQIGFGIPLLKLRRKKGELRFGVAGKAMWRRGGFQNPTMTQLLTFDLKSIANNLDNFGSGMGIDTGLQFVYSLNKKLLLMSGVAVTDLGDTSFTNGVGSQKSNLTGGVAARFSHSDMVATLAYDYSHFFENMDWKKKNHLGLELKFPLLRLYTGLNQVYPTYGVGLDFWLIRLMYLSYAEEQLSSAPLNPDRRTMLNCSIKFEF
jgi:hypothetical protein